MLFADSRMACYGFKLKLFVCWERVQTRAHGGAVRGMLAGRGEGEAGGRAHDEDTARALFH